MVASALAAQEPAPPGGRGGRGRASADQARRGMPARHDARPRRAVPGPRVARAEHRRLPPEVDARCRRAPGSAREVSGRRHPQPHRTDDAQSIEQLIKEMDALNIRVLNNLSGGYGAELKQTSGLHPEHEIREPVHGVRQWPEWIPRRGARATGKKAAAQLEADVTRRAPSGSRFSSRRAWTR